jgi:hypothetical protein
MPATILRMTAQWRQNKAELWEFGRNRGFHKAALNRRTAFRAVCFDKAKNQKPGASAAELSHAKNTAHSEPRSAPFRLTGNQGRFTMRLAALIGLAALMLAVIVTLAPNVSVYDEASFDSLHTSMQVAAR